MRRSRTQSAKGVDDYYLAAQRLNSKAWLISFVNPFLSGLTPGGNSIPTNVFKSYGAATKLRSLSRTKSVSPVKLCKTSWRIVPSVNLRRQHAPLRTHFEHFDLPSLSHAMDIVLRNPQRLGR